MGWNELLSVGHVALQKGSTLFILHISTPSVSLNQQDMAATANHCYY